MRLENMTPAHVRRAVELYLQLAFPDASGPRPRIDAGLFANAATLGETFAKLDCGQQDQESGSLRYTLRLGNWRYPFMKFVVQEYLVDEEFFFSVDTHDNLDVRPGQPDYEAWQVLKAFNRDLREQIERTWHAAGLPTQEDLRKLAEGLAEVEREEQKRQRLLLVDDETDVCRGLAALLRARGYEVETAFTGEQMLERIGRDPLPDLVLLDFELPGLDGEEVLARMKGSARTADLPVLMATAASIDMARLRRASGFLHKPYSRDVLFAMIARLLERPRPASAPRP